jgi:hypothetical protein
LLGLLLGGKLLPRLCVLRNSWAGCNPHLVRLFRLELEQKDGVPDQQQQRCHAYPPRALARTENAPKGFPTKALLGSGGGFSRAAE